MIFIVFISIAISYFFIRYFENRRKQRNADRREKRQEAYNNLLNTIKENSLEDNKN